MSSADGPITHIAHIYIFFNLLQPGGQIKSGTNYQPLHYFSPKHWLKSQKELLQLKLY